MINKIKIGLLVAFLSLVVVSSASAADLVFNEDTTVTIGAASYTITGGSSATSIAPGATTIVIVMPDSATLTFKSADRYVLNNTYGAADCNASFSSLTMNRSGTFTITPDATATCTTGTGGSPAPSPSPSPAPAPAPATPATPAVPAIPATPAVPGVSPVVPATPATPAVGAAITYNLGTKTLRRGSTGASVKELQRFLNDKLNLGLKLDGKLGPKTIAVIKKWQKANGLVADGLIGTKTKAKMNASVQ